MSARGIPAACLIAAALTLGFSAHAGGGGKGRKAAGKQGQTHKNSNHKNSNHKNSNRTGRDAPRTTGQGVATPSAVRAKKAADIELGAPIRYHNISIVPVFTKKVGPFQRYTLLESGLEGKTLAVRELEGNTSSAQVNAVEVRNRGERPVYLLGGEMILGGKQDRIIARDTVVPANAKWTKVSVFCVEQGRWNGQNMKFKSGKAVADVSVIRAAMKGSQSEVWSQVRKKNVLHGTESATQTYRRTIQNGDVRKKVSPYVSDIRSRLPRGKKLAGLVFGINGKINVADVFGNPVLFRDLEGKLLSAYVLEALSHQVVRNARPVSRKAAESFIGKGRRLKSKAPEAAGSAKSYGKEDKDFIGTETVDAESDETVREQYINK